MNISAKELKAIFAAWVEAVDQNRLSLIKLDSAAGDGDLGIAMSDGFRASFKALEESEETDLGKLIYRAGKAFASAAPSTTGTLFASGLISSANAFRGAAEMDSAGLARWMRGVLEQIMRLGGAKPGEKTLLDALIPAVDALEQESAAGSGLAGAAHAAAAAAKQGAQSTTDMLAVHGRAAVRGEGSRGLIDPGAVLIQLLFQALDGCLSGMERV